MRVGIYKIIKITSGRLHCWCESNVGVIRKPNSIIPNFLWDAFFGKKPKKEPQKIVRKEMTYKLKEEKLKWYQRLWNWVLKLFRR